MTETVTNLARPGRFSGLRLVMSLLLLAVLAGPAGAAPARVPAVRVSQEASDRVVFRVLVPQPKLSPSAAIEGAQRLDIDGYSRVGDPGAPAILTRSFLVGLPPTGSFSISSRIISTRPLGAHRLEPVATPIGIHDEDFGPVLSERVIWDEEVFSAYRDPAPVIAEPEVYIRHQRALPIRVNPVSYDVQSRSLSVAQEIEIEVRFQAPRVQDTGIGRDERRDWNEIFGRLLVNATQSQRWPSAKQIPVENQMLGAVRVLPGAIKIRVRETGMHRVRASRAVAAGFPSGQPVANLRMFRRSYSDAGFAGSESEIACEVREDPAGTAGVFDGADEVVFYGKRLRDDATQGDQREQYSTYNVYWLEPSAGTRMTQRTPAAGFVSADTATVSFPVNADRFETDLVFDDGAPNIAPFDIYYYNYGYEAGPVDMPFNVNTVAPGTSVTISSELLGQTFDSPRNVRVSLFNSKGEKVLSSFFAVPGKARRTFSAQVAAADLDLGVNQLRINRPDASRTSLQVLLNWVDVSYNALFRARGNSLRFNSGALSGDTTITVTGITSSNGLDLYDVTNPEQPQRVLLSAANFQPVTGGTALAFRENIPSRRDFVLVPHSRVVDVQAEALVADTPSAIVGGPAEGGIDVLVVSHRDFMSGMQQWASYRRAQGYRVLLVDVEDVYDEFNGGVPNARAIYRFARHFFERGNAAALVLVGDSSEDHKHVHNDSGENFVPTYVRFDRVSSLLLDEVVTTDKRFVKFPGPGGSVDPIPDMIIGRIPVGTPGELEVVLAKVFDYESPSPSDFWRKRMIIVADDEYSEGSSTFGGLQFCDNGEIGFEIGQEQVAQMIENSLPAGFDVVRFYLKQYTDAFYTTQCANRFAAINFTRQNATERLMSELNKGATMVAIQSHMSRYVITHERLLSGEPASILNGSTGRDYLRVENRFKPWIIFGMGCHFSEYAIHRELAQDRLIYNSPNGDCFAEQYLFQDERGAVATYGSSGFEYLGENNDYMNTTARVWFYEAPYDTMVNQTQAEWKLGQLMYLTEAQMAVTHGFGQSGQPEPVERYHILGDPLLRIDAGPPAFDVTSNGRPVQNGDVIGTGGERDSIDVIATVTDENAIHKFSLEIDGQDLTDSLSVVRLSDPSLAHARQYRVEFRHLLAPKTYDIVLRAYQSPDTTAGKFHMAAEFRLKVESSIKVSVNGRGIESGAAVPADGSYRIDLSFPIFIPQSAISVSIDDTPVPGAQYNHPSPEDSLSWIITFRKKLDAGEHHLLVDAGDIEFSYQLVVSESAGLENVINFPNPFRADGTNFLYSNDVEITNGTIDIFTVSGKKVRQLEIPFSARLPGENTVHWDGRDGAGSALANGVYLYVIRVTQRSGSATVRGSISKIE